MHKELEERLVKGRVSIIVPIYNAEKYLEQCLDSIFNQEYDNYQLICVNDGSTDGSLRILNNYLSKKEKITLINKKHSNAGDARNTGIEEADGEYITFWDSDEIYYPSYLSDAIYALESTVSDAVIMGANYFYDDNFEELFDASWMLESSIVGKENSFCVKDNADVILNVSSCSPWNKVFRTKCITDNKLQFQSIGRANDVLFISSIMMCCNKVAFVKEKSVAHREHSQSLQGSDTGIGMEFYKALLSVKQFIDSRAGFEIFSTSFIRMAYRFIEDKIWNAPSVEICKYLLEQYPRMKETLELKEECFSDNADFYFGIRHRLLISESIDEKSKPDCIGIIKDVFNVFLEQKKVLDNYQKSYEELCEECDYMHRNKVWPLPYDKMGSAKDIVIYGAGDVGNDLCHQLLRSTQYHLVALIDRNYNKVHKGLDIEIQKKDLLSEIDFDCIIIAIRDKTVQKSVLFELTDVYKVPKDKIICY